MNVKPKRIAIIGLSLVALAGAIVAGVFYYDSLPDREYEAQRRAEGVRAAIEYRDAVKNLSRFKSEAQRKAEGISDEEYERRLNSK